MLSQFGASEIHVNLPVEEIFSIGPLPVTNSMILGAFGILVMLVVLGAAALALHRG